MSKISNDFGILRRAVWRRSTNHALPLKNLSKEFQHFDIEQEHWGGFSWWHLACYDIVSVSVKWDEGTGEARLTGRLSLLKADFGHACFPIKEKSIHGAEAVSSKLTLLACPCLRVGSRERQATLYFDW